MPTGADGSRLRVLLANDGDGPLEGFVTALGHTAVASHESPDVAVVSAAPAALGIIDQLVRDAACPAVLALDGPDPELVRQASRRGLSAVVMGREPANWHATLAVALRRFADYRDLKTAFERRATIERAKGVLMERHSIGEDDAFAMLRDRGRAANLRLLDVASAVLGGHTLLPRATTPVPHDDATT